MSGYLLDTNLLSEVIRKRPAASVIERLRMADSSQLFTSAICVMDLRFGASRQPKGQVLWKRIEEEVISLVRILPLGQKEAQRAGHILAMLTSHGQPINTEDVLIAATALENSLTVVTRNVRHLGRISGLRVESWWE